MLLKFNEKKKKQKLAGVYIPAKNYVLINLYALLHMKSNSQVLREWLAPHIQQLENNKFNIIHELRKKINTLWSIEYSKNKHYTYEKFKKDICKRLKNIPEEIINQLFDDEKNKS